MELSEQQEIDLKCEIEDGYALLGLPSDTESTKCVEKVEAWINWAQRTDRQVDDLFIAVGAAFGDAIARKIGWRWSWLEENGKRYLALIAPQDTHALLPQSFISRRASGADPGNTILTFNMLIAGNLPSAKPGDLLTLE